MLQLRKRVAQVVGESGRRQNSVSTRLRIACSPACIRPREAHHSARVSSPSMVDRRAESHKGVSLAFILPYLTGLTDGRADQELSTQHIPIETDLARRLRSQAQRSCSRRLGQGRPRIWSSGYQPATVQEDESVLACPTHNKFPCITSESVSPLRVAALLTCFSSIDLPCIAYTQPNVPSHPLMPSSVSYRYCPHHCLWLTWRCSCA